jgi:quercetin dioxygenase-like cupin family protein
MKVIHLSDEKKIENAGSLFTAPVTQQFIPTNKESSPTVVYVHFPKGVRNKLHTHDNEQILVVTEGTGIVATESEEQNIIVGDVVVIPAGEKHWHGATKDSEMTHIAISAARTSLTQIEE